MLRRREFPLPRVRGKRLRVLRPVVQGRRIEVGAVRPNERMRVHVKPSLPALRAASSIEYVLPTPGAAPKEIFSFPVPASPLRLAHGPAERQDRGVGRTFLSVRERVAVIAVNVPPKQIGYRVPLLQLSPESRPPEMFL